MERLNGIVMEKSTTHVILMTSMGEFKRVRVTGHFPDIGEEVSIPVTHRRTFSLPKARWMAVAAAGLLLLTASPLLNLIKQPPDQVLTPGVALTEKNTPEVTPVQEITEPVQTAINPEPSKAPAVSEKTTSEAATAPEKVAVSPTEPKTTVDTPADTPGDAPADTSAGSSPVIPDEVKTATKNEPAVTVLKTDRNYIDSGKTSQGSGSSQGQDSGSSAPSTPVESGSSAQSGTAADAEQTVSLQDTIDNYMGTERPGDRETGGGVDIHLQKPNF